MLKDKSEVTAICIDNGLFVELALRLSRDYKKVYYCVPGWTSGFPRMHEAWVGMGLDGITVVDDFWPVYDEIDLWFFPDVYFGGMQLYLEGQGKKVWGARMGEEMELNRDAMKKHMANLGLPVNPWRKIKGIDKLREYLKQHGKKWVKINKWRGMMESFFSKDYKSIEPKLDEVEYALGAFKHIMEFIVEDDLPDCVEVGIDAYTIDGKFPKKLLTGIEIKDKGFVGYFTDYAKLPDVITRFDETMSETLKNFGYRGFYSTELRIGKDHKPYMIDQCARAGSPPSELYQEIYTNLGDIIWQGANGKVIDPIPAAKYGAEILIHSSWADKNWQPIDFPEKYRNLIKLRNLVKIKGTYYVVPQDVGLPEIGAVIGMGETLEDAIKQAHEVAESVTGYYIQVFPESLDEATEQIDKIHSFGIDYFPEDEDEQDLAANE